MYSVFINRNCISLLTHTRRLKYYVKIISKHNALKWNDLQDVLLSEKKSICKTVYIVGYHFKTRDREITLYTYYIYYIQISWRICKRLNISEERLVGRKE